MGITLKRCKENEREKAGKREKDSERYQNRDREKVIVRVSERESGCIERKMI